MNEKDERKVEYIWAELRAHDVRLHDLETRNQAHCAVCGKFDFQGNLWSAHARAPGALATEGTIRVHKACAEGSLVLDIDDPESHQW